MVKHYHSLALFSLVVYSILLINTDDKSLVSFVDGFSNRATFGSSTSSKRYQSSYTSLPSTIKLVKANHHHISRLVPLYMSVGDDNDINKSNNSEDTDTTTTTTEEQLQKRFEEAMNRRKQRGVLKDEGIELDRELQMGNWGKSWKKIKDILKKENEILLIEKYKQKQFKARHSESRKQSVICGWNVT